MAEIDQTTRGIEVLFEDDAIENSTDPFVIQIRNKCPERVTREDVRDDLALANICDKYYLRILPREGVRTDLTIYFDDNETTGAMVIHGEHLDVAIMTVTELIGLQERTDNAFVCCIYGGLFSGRWAVMGIKKEGLYIIREMNVLPKDEDKVFITINNLVEGDETFLQAKNDEAEGKRNKSEELPDIFAPYENPKYVKLVEDHEAAKATKESV